MWDAIHGQAFSKKELETIIQAVDMMREIRKDELQTIMNWTPTFKKGIINHFKHETLRERQGDDEQLHLLGKKLEELVQTTLPLPEISLGMARILFTPDTSPLPRGDFAAALMALKDGFAVCRAGWSRPGMFLELIDPYHNDEYQVTEKPQISGTLMSHIVLKTADNQIIPWVASQSCLLATDWQLYFTGKNARQEAIQLIDPQP